MASNQNQKEYMTEFAMQLKQARKDKHLTQVQLAELTGMCQEEISKIENNHRKASVTTAARIAEALGFKIALVAQ